MFVHLLVGKLNKLIVKSVFYKALFSPPGQKISEMKKHACSVDRSVFGVLFI